MASASECQELDWELSVEPTSTTTTGESVHMKSMRVPLLAAIALLLSAAPSRAEFGVGINLGEPTGLNLRVGKDRTMEVTAGWSAKHAGTNIVLLGNVLYHGRSVLSNPPLMGLYPYAGAGLGFWMWDDKNNDDADQAGAWVQVPLGLDLRFAIPLELTFHIDPGIDVVPQTSATIHWGVGIRYWLK